MGQQPGTTPPSGRPAVVWTLSALALAIVLLLVMKQRLTNGGPAQLAGSSNSQSSVSGATPASINPFARRESRTLSSVEQLPAEQIVSNKLARFAKSREGAGDKTQSET